MSTQKFTRIYDYIHEYQNLVYDFYSKDVVAFLTTYYHIDSAETIWEDENVFAGSYDRVGEFSGVRWNKILLLPVYYIEDINTIYDGQEIGYVKENETTFVIPSTYNFTPLPNDKLKLEQEYLRPVNDTYPVFNVSGVEKSVNADRLFWKLKVHVEQSITENDLNAQVLDTYVFYEYDKQIHELEDAQCLTRLLSKNEILRDRLKNGGANCEGLFDGNSGFYLV